MNRKAQIAAALILSASTLGAAGFETEPKPRRVTRPLSTISVKTVAAVDYARKAEAADRTVTADGKPAPWLITASDSDSCTAWVSERSAPNIATAQLNAFIACQRVLAGS